LLDQIKNISSLDSLISTVLTAVKNYKDNEQLVYRGLCLLLSLSEFAKEEMTSKMEEKTQLLKEIEQKSSPTSEIKVVLDDLRNVFSLPSSK
jgi:hypothetical protein